MNGEGEIREQKRKKTAKNVSFEMVKVNKLLRGFVFELKDLTESARWFAR